ncbi:uncharacterized protein [Pleurodeles waltl]|uniref:uncharacterized protein n=1 Tax=Pleurodeles waltl TaxID=8319 RepID=UPI0037096DE6
MIERYNGLLKEQLKKLSAHQTLKGWSSNLDKALFELNNRPVGQQTPFIRMAGHDRETIHTMIVWKRNPRARLPLQATSGSVGLDLFAPEDGEVPVGQVKTILLEIGVRVPPGTYGRIAPRSSLVIKGVLVLGEDIDPDYRGEVKVVLLNQGNAAVSYKAHDRLAQLICEQAYTPHIEESSAPPDNTQRGEGGFGSTGRKVWVHHPGKKPEAGEILS